MRKWVKIGIASGSLIVGIPFVVFLSLNVIYGGNPIYRVTTGNMEPALHQNEYVLVSHNEPFDRLQVGDIIVYIAPDDRTVISRVIEVTDDAQGDLIVRTKADAYSASLPPTEPVRSESYIGKVVGILGRGG